MSSGRLLCWRLHLYTASFGSTMAVVAKLERDALFKKLRAKPENKVGIER